MSLRQQPERPAMKRALGPSCLPKPHSELQNPGPTSAQSVAFQFNLPRGSMYTTIMELGPQNHNGDGLLGPNSIIVVYMDPLGLTSDQSSGRSKTRWWSSCVEVRPLQEQHNIGALTARRGFGVYYRVILVAEFIRPKRCTLLFLEWEVFSQKV